VSLTTAQISAQVDHVLASCPDAAAVAVHARSRSDWPDSLNLRGRRLELRWCESMLAMRQALMHSEDDDPKTGGLIILTPLATNEIADDIAARLARARVFQPEGWETVRQLFQAKRMDARLGRFAWMPQALLEASADGPYPPAVNAFLGLDAAWQQVLQRLVGITEARPDAVTLLAWSAGVGEQAALDRLPAAARTDVLEWLALCAGRAGPAIVGCAQTGRTADALPLGLVCAVVFSTQAEGEAALAQAAVRLERYVADRHLAVEEGRAWARTAEAALRLLPPETARLLLDRADALLRDLRVSAFAHLSIFLPDGLDQRLQGYAAALEAHVAEPSAPHLRAVEAAADRALSHTMLQAQPGRRERVEMARRVSRWLLAPSQGESSLQGAAAWQCDEGAFLDWARFRLLGGDELAELSQAYAACREALTRRRNPMARTFAAALLDWNARQPAIDGRLVPVEAALEHVLAPIAAQHPVLLLVMDGLSISIYRELFARCTAIGWAEHVSLDLGRALVGVAALPTITEVSRASLLCGKLVTGASAQEKPGFATHPALVARSHAGAPPRLFHKGELADAGSLAIEVRNAIAEPRQKIVGVVYNAVDDHLSGPDQLHQRWALEDLRLLLPILREAREARRVVVVTADHGHLLEDATSPVEASGAPDRWRPGNQARTAREMVARGGRVLTPDGADIAVCLWEENTRYGLRKNGYHGGMSPQEVTVPLAVLAPLGMTIEGWTPAPPGQPLWWDLSPLATETATRLPAAPLMQPAKPARPSARKSSTVGQPQLFDEQEAAPTAARPPEVDWLSALFASPAYASQKQLAARVALPDLKMRALLEGLGERGGKLSRAAAAQRLSEPEMRLGGMLNAARRVLNLDQAPVLVVDDAAGTIELNKALLVQQFRLEVSGGWK
jgi:hypothetical protein